MTANGLMGVRHIIPKALPNRKIFDFLPRHFMIPPVHHTLVSMLAMNDDPLRKPHFLRFYRIELLATAFLLLRQNQKNEGGMAIECQVRTEEGCRP